jgi:hypothetical protein
MAARSEAITNATARAPSRAPRRRRVARMEPTGPARSGRPDDRLREIRDKIRRWSDTGATSFQGAPISSRSRSLTGHPLRWCITSRQRLADGVATNGQRAVPFPDILGRAGVPPIPGADRKICEVCFACDPLPTLRPCPYGQRRTARGQCGSLLLHCRGLAPHTPCRSPGARGAKPILRSHASFLTLGSF